MSTLCVTPIVSAIEVLDKCSHLIKHTPARGGLCRFWTRAQQMLECTLHMASHSEAPVHACMSQCLLQAASVPASETYRSTLLQAAAKHADMVLQDADVDASLLLAAAHTFLCAALPEQLAKCVQRIKRLRNLDIVALKALRDLCAHAAYQKEAYDLSCAQVLQLQMSASGKPPPPPNLHADCLAKMLKAQTSVLLDGLALLPHSAWCQASNMGNLLSRPSSLKLHKTDSCSIAPKQHLMVLLDHVQALHSTVDSLQSLGQVRVCHVVSCLLSVVVALPLVHVMLCTGISSEHMQLAAASK